MQNEFNMEFNRITFFFFLSLGKRKIRWIFALSELNSSFRLSCSDSDSRSLNKIRQTLNLISVKEEN